MKIKSLLIGFVTGAVVAGAATLLSAPNSGKDLRIRLQNGKENLNAAIEELLSKIQSIKSETIEAAQTSKDSLKSFVSDVQFLIEDWKRDIEPNKTELFKNIQEIEQSLKELEEMIPARSNKE